MKIVILGKRHATPEQKEVERLAMDFYIAQYPEDTVFDHSHIPWAKLQEVYGSYNAAYAWIVTQFDMFVMASESTFVSRGMFEIAGNALKAGREVRLFDGTDEHTVASMEVSNADDWKGAYGEVITESVGSL